MGGYVNISEDYNHQTLVPWLKPLVDSLLESTKYNQIKVKISNLDSSAPLFVLVTQGYNKCDRFTLLIPYAQEILQWPISFVWSHPEAFPIIGFDDNLFTPNFGEIRGLLEWDSSNPNALIHLVDDFLDSYRNFQISICRQHDRLAMELDNLVDFDSSKMDVLIDHAEAVFVFSLTVEGVLDLPKVYIADNLIDNRVTLKVKYRLNTYSATVELLLCPFLNVLFGPKNGPKLPPLECFLHEYVDTVQEILNNAIRDIKELFDYRQNFIINCRNHFKNTVDGDFTFFTNISFLMNCKDFSYVLHVKLTNGWPGGPIDTQAISVYHERRQDESPYLEKLTWKPSNGEDKSDDQLFDEFCKFVEEIGPKFQKSSCSLGVV